VKPPVLETARLRLRPFTPSDAPEIRRLAGVREIADTTKRIPHPYGDGVAEAWIATHAELHETNRALTLAIERRDETLVGAIDLRLDEENGNAEIGYWIRVDAWGRGYATEAACAGIDHGFEVLGLHRIWAGHFERNPASGRVMEKLGFSPEGILRAHVRKWGKFENLVVRGILRPEWEKRRHEDRPGNGGA
jgi:RimJ/RimL family protein N-acetyltransferase